MMFATLLKSHNGSQPGGGGPAGQDTVIVCARVQKLNTPMPIVTTLAGIVMFVRLVTPMNASSPIDVTLAGIVMLVRAVIANAFSPIDVTLAGIVMLVMPVFANT